MPSAHAAVFFVATETELANAITTANTNGEASNTINITGNITLSGPLPTLGVRDAAGIPLTTGSLTIDGNGNTVSAGGAQRIFFANAGTVAISNVTLADGLAKGGNGGDSDNWDTGAGGGGMGAGGALFVRAGTTVTVDAVAFANNSAVGGNGGQSGSGDNGGGGGGGLGGNGGTSTGNTGGGGGGGAFADGQDTDSDDGGAGGGPHGGAGGVGYGNPGTSGGDLSGGGGGAEDGDGGNGGFGGGGGGGGDINAPGGAGGYGGGGGGADGQEGTGGQGGFGGGGGGSQDDAGGLGGFGGGSGAQGNAAHGGGGAGFGGAVFVQEGGTLIIKGSGTMGGGSVTGGTGYQNGQAAGSGIFLQNATVEFSPAAGETQTIVDVIADDTGNGPSTGGKVNKSGAGLLVLAGENTNSGATTVSAGELRVTGAIANSAVTVEYLATLSGSGEVGSVLAESGSFVSPGNGTVGTLTVAGAYDQQSGASYVVDFGPGGTSDLIEVDGTATLAGGAKIVIGNVGATFAPGQRYTVLHAAGGLSGEFEVPALSAFLGLADSYDYVFNYVYLDVVQTRDLADAGRTRNQIATAAALDGLAPGNDIVDALLLLPDDQAARAAFDALSGEIHASAKTVLIEDSRFVRDAMGARLRASFGASVNDAQAVMALDANAMPMAVAADHAGPAFWTQGFGSWGSTNGDGNAAAVDRSTGGMFGGLDRSFGDWRLGMLAGYSHTSFDVDDRAASGNSDNYHLGLYGGGQWGAFGLRAGAAYSWNDIETTRGASFTGFSERLKSDYDAGTFQAFGEVGYGVELGTARFEPFANLSFVNLDTDGYSESGGDAALRSDDSSTETTFTTLGLRAEAGFGIGSIDAAARGMIGWRHAFGDTLPRTAQAFSGGNDFTITGVEIAEDAAVVEAGFNFGLPTGATLGLSYTGQLAEDASDHGVKADLSLSF